MVAGLVPLGDQGDLGGGVATIRIGGVHGKAGEAPVALAGLVGLVEHEEGPEARRAAAIVVGMKGETEEPLLVAGGADAIGEIEKHFPAWIGEVGDDRDPPGLLDDEESVRLTRCDDEGDGIGEEEAGKRVHHRIVAGGKIRRQVQGRVGDAGGGGEGRRGRQHAGGGDDGPPKNPWGKRLEE